MSWIGMDVREYSSGGKHNRMGITKQGDRCLRRLNVACAREMVGFVWESLNAVAA
jgi:transposase